MNTPIDKEVTDALQRLYDEAFALGFAKGYGAKDRENTPVAQANNIQQYTYYECPYCNHRKPLGGCGGSGAYQYE